MKPLLILFLLAYCGMCTAQVDVSKKTYHFGEYTAKMNYCTEASSIEILRGNKQLYYICGGESQIYYIDTLSVNDDDIPDFIMADMDEYIVLSALVSTKNNTYRIVDITDIFDGGAYSNTPLSKGEKFEDFRLVDIDKDGRRDILTNLIVNDKGGFRPSDMTDTILHKNLKRDALK